MSALRTVRAAYRAGVLLSTDGTQLLLTGRGELSPELRADLLAHKPSIITILTVYGVGTTDGYGLLDGAHSAVKRYAPLDGCLGLGACSRLGWCQPALDGRRCADVKGRGA